MFDLKNKNSINAKTSQQNFTIKSILKPDLSKLNLVSNQIIWFRQPPPPYEIEELSFNLNKILYKCSSLDYQCSIICKVISEQTGQLVDRFDYGPIETFLFNRSSPINEFRVNLVLFGQYKKCIFALNQTPTLINPINNNKYTLTQQDLRSIYFLNQQENTDMQEQSQNPDSNRYSTSSASDKTKFITNKNKKTIIVGNLFQRLILLKLFHEIPNGMYCHSTELLQIIFYDQTSCNMVLMALNRFKYQKKQPSQISKSMFNTLQQSAVTKIMKKSKDSFTNLNSIKNSQHHSKSSADQSFHSSTKKEFLPLAMLKSLKKSPKESINSVHQSLASKNSNRLNQSKILPDGQQSRLNTSLLQNESKETLRYPESCSRLSIKHPKISILSTDINSTKQTRQQKVSFPQTPNTQHLKSSELIIKPNEFKSCLSLRRSQQEIKTPRMDADDSVNLSSIKGPIKKKSISLIEDPDETQEECKYVNQFQNLLFQVDESQTKEQQLCLNDSFAKLEQQEQKQKSKYYQSAQKAQIQIQIGNFQIVNHTSPLIVTEFQDQESQPSIHSLKQTLQSVLNENSQLKRKNQELRKQIDEIVQVGGKRNQILKYQKQIQRMKEIKKSLIKEIESLKISACSIKSQSSQKHLHLAVFSPQRIEYKPHNYQTQTKNIIDHFGSIQKKKITATQHKSSISPPRHSKHGNQPYFKYTQPPSPTFAGRRSHQHGCPSFILKQGEPEAINKNTNTPMNSGELKFFRLQNDQGYMKFRTNQSYSYKTTQTFKFEEKRTDKTNNYKSSN